MRAAPTLIVVASLRLARLVAAPIVMAVALHPFSATAIVAVLPLLTAALHLLIATAVVSISIALTLGESRPSGGQEHRDDGGHNHCSFHAELQSVGLFHPTRTIDRLSGEFGALAHAAPYVRYRTDCSRDASDHVRGHYRAKSP
jgi:hypothetical protein